MKSFAVLAVTIMISPFWGSPAQAQGSFPRLTCEKCRNPRRFPRDFRNFAYNQIFGPNGTMNYGDADFFQVKNLTGHSVFIDMNIRVGFVMSDFGALPVPLPYPTIVRVQIILIYQNGDQRKYMIDPRAHPNGLPVGQRRTRGGGGGGVGGRAGSGPPLPRPPRSTRRCGTSQVDDGAKRRTCL